MKRDTVLCGAVLAVALSFGVAAKANATCTLTGFFVDGFNLNAAMINPGGLNGTALDATGCNIGVYYDDGTNIGPVGGTVTGATISGANYFGIVVNGGHNKAPVNVNVTNSTIQNIGEVPQNGTQHGVAIFYTNGSTSAMADDSRTCSGAGMTTGDISGNTVSGYQKNGIVAKCAGVGVMISDNMVTGAGPVNYIAQNGIEVGVGAVATVSGNTVSANAYTGANDADSSGILVFGGGPFGDLAIGEQILNNTLTGNDVGIFSVNCGNLDCTIAPRTSTNNTIKANSLSNANISNVSGCGSPQGYQAAISELGRNDNISQNKISGAGYTPNGVACTGTGTTPAIFSIDKTERQGPRP
jgi:hypothetical protein